MKRVVPALISMLSAAALALSAQSVPAGNGVEAWTPWEASIFANFTRADFPGLPNSLAILNTQLNSGGLTPIYTGADINLSGGEINLQQNFRSWLGFQIDASGGASNRFVAVPSADASTLNDSSAFHLAPNLLTVAYGPVVTRRSTARLEPWARVLAGVAHADLCPDAEFKTAVRADDNSFAFANSGLALQGGLGVDVSLRRSIFLRLGVDDLRTWLFNGEQNQVRAAAGIAWRFGSGSEE